MDYNPVNLNSWSSKLVTRFGRKWRSHRPNTQQASTKNNGKPADPNSRRRESSKADSNGQEDVNELGERNYSVYSQASALLKNKDHTDMMHGLAHHDSFDSLIDAQHERLKDPEFNSESPEVLRSRQEVSERRLKQFERLPAHVWENVAAWLRPADAACLALPSRALYYDKLGANYLRTLNDPSNEREKTLFLHRLDIYYPDHLLCYPCARYHPRLSPGKESLKADITANPIFLCPRVRDTTLPRMRLTHGRELPYAFIQLATRAQRYGSAYGVGLDALARKWKCKDSPWTHRTRYLLHDGHLLMRVVSSCTAPPAAQMTETSQRHLLYDREEYTPFFSVCAHWKDGNLMQTCKCALSHIPSPPQSYAQQLRKAPTVNAALARPNFIVQGCDDCRPARRCPECPSEYLVEVNMIEDPADSVRPFKHAIVVTRWCDLGDGSGPLTSTEYTALQGKSLGGLNGVDEYDSFSHVGRRAVGGVFESRVSGTIPGQRMVSMNPGNAKEGDEGHGWY